MLLLLTWEPLPVPRWSPQLLSFQWFTAPYGTKTALQSHPATLCSLMQLPAQMPSVSKDQDLRKCSRKAKKVFPKLCSYRLPGAAVPGRSLSISTDSNRHKKGHNYTRVKES